MKQLLLTLVLALTSLTTLAAPRPNVLFLAVDDLRPQLNCYGQSFMHTPNMDRLASRGVLFERAYCMVPTCGASRASMMTSIRPARDRFVDHLTWAEKDARGVTTLNTHFRNNSYITISLGKIFHHPADNASGWTEPAWQPSASDYRNVEAMKRAQSEDTRKYPGISRRRNPAYEAADASDDAYPDGQTALKAVAYLQRFARQPEQPFFLAVGFLKPHLPFNAPQKYWDLYELEKIDLPPNYRAPKDAPAGALHPSGELRGYAHIPPSGPVSRETAQIGRAHV